MALTKEIERSLSLLIDVITGHCIIRPRLKKCRLIWLGIDELDDISGIALENIKAFK